MELGLGWLDMLSFAFEILSVADIPISVCGYRTRATELQRYFRSYVSSTMMIPQLGSNSCPFPLSHPSK